MSQLFTAEDLRTYMGVPVSVERAMTIERVVWGWLKGPLGLTERPAVLPEHVFSWAVELGALAHENPLGPPEGDPEYAVSRRDEILSAAAITVTPPTPRGCFPDPLPWPDPR